MSTETQTLTDLKDLRAAGPGAEVAAEAREPQIDPHQAAGSERFGRVDRHLFDPPHGGGRQSCVEYILGARVMILGVVVKWLRRRDDF